MNPCLLACVSALLASKFIEMDDNLIMVSELQDFIKKDRFLDQNMYLSYEDVTRSELQVLHHF